MLYDISLETRNYMILQHDGFLAHNAIALKNYSNEMFENGWMRTNGIIEWLSRSSDLSLMDYFLLGYLKTIVYAVPRTSYTLLIF